ncbi:two-component system phosphate regulon response regulator PhoB [Desulfosalsimonas propionicica]|jgi:two-component system phosphate regulon response regulator PhoB|uniref:Two-component system phosphate regulon response regulator PhoB n=1 Tax=Desulfosalsimonas propionicica TaxID=332175 RepID=A0A7W0C895_9BACT|nr:response regulator transcription factor [Desulfosalsimonas propionicica]MBA2880981.1 two-component system phosphate regulon response regulator PhoB [Desulfosalsimonas propionicica]
MQETILVIEDDTDILNLIAWHLEHEGFRALKESSGDEGLEAAIREHPCMVILDLMLPGTDGLEVCKTLKRNQDTQNIPVIMLTAKGEEVDRIVGFELGADDYIVKPFSPRELMLRIKAVLRRHAPPQEADEENLLRHKDMVLEPENYRIRIGDRELHLTVTEFNLLFDLLKNRGRVRSRDILLDRVWGYQFEGYHRTVDTHIRRLRQKIEPYADDIETVRGVGYRFREN